MKPVTMLIGADLVPTESNFELFEKGDVETLVGDEILAELNLVDYRIFNLELALCDETAEPIKKCGPNLRAPKGVVNGIRALNPSLLAVANNHILDFGDEGLRQTVEVLEENGLPFVGVGENLFEAQKPYIFEKNGKRIGVYACAEHEFTIAEVDKAGANPFDPFESLDHISALKVECDYVIVLYHGGKEYYRFPSPYLQKVCRKICEKGADLVVCQHSHCVGCMEEYNESVIVYGQGNFLFDRSNAEPWQTAIFVKATFGETMQVEYLPLQKKDNLVRLANGANAEEILNKFYERTEMIKVKDFVEINYKRFADYYKENYFYCFAGGASRFPVFEDFSWDYGQKILLGMRNYIECEAHRELFLTALKEDAKAKND